MTSWAGTSTDASSTASRSDATEASGPGPQGSGPFFCLWAFEARDTVRAMNDRGRLRAISALFFASGAAGLVYEVVWSRLLKELFGVTAYAVAAVLATYLAGLALGGWLL